MARSVSKVTVDFFKTLDMHASSLTQIVEEAKTVNDKKLSELEEKFEVIGLEKLIYQMCLLIVTLFLVLLFFLFGFLPSNFFCICRSVLLMKKGSC